MACLRKKRRKTVYTTDCCCFFKFSCSFLFDASYLRNVLLLGRYSDNNKTERRNKTQRTKGKKEMRCFIKTRFLDIHRNSCCVSRVVLFAVVMLEQLQWKTKKKRKAKISNNRHLQNYSGEKKTHHQTIWDAEQVMTLLVYKNQH